VFELETKKRIEKFQEDVPEQYSPTILDKYEQK
jgi:hypothetical protein